jgi:hypothetical protein
MIRNPLFRAGIVLQCCAAFLIGVIVLAVRLHWIDIVGIGLEGGIDQPSAPMLVFHWGFLGLLLAFGSGFALYAAAFHRLKRAQQLGEANLHEPV